MGEHNQPKEVLEARPFALKHAQIIGATANKCFPTMGAGMATMIGTITMQNILISAILNNHLPGSTEGVAVIERCYEAAKKDCVARFKALDIVRARQEGIIK